jgi:hypothetical protein
LSGYERKREIGKIKVKKRLNEGFIFFMCLDTNRYGANHNRGGRRYHLYMRTGAWLQNPNVNILLVSC